MTHHRLICHARHLVARAVLGISVLFALCTTLRTAPQRGQGTVEYVALILLVAGVLAGAVAMTKSSKFDLAKQVETQITNAITKVGGAK